VFQFTVYGILTMIFNTIQYIDCKDEYKAAHKLLTSDKALKNLIAELSFYEGMYTRHEISADKFSKIVVAITNSQRNAQEARSGVLTKIVNFTY